MAKKEGVFRVYFHTADLEELKVLLKETPEHAVIDYLCREGAAPFGAIEEGGYHHYATYLKKTDSGRSRGESSGREDGEASL